MQQKSHGARASLAREAQGQPCQDLLLLLGTGGADAQCSMVDEGGIVAARKRRRRERTSSAGGPDRQCIRCPPAQSSRTRGWRSEQTRSQSQTGRPFLAGGGENEWVESHNGREQRVGNRRGESPRRAEIEPLSKGVSLLRACRALGSRRWVMVPEYEKGTWKTARKGREIRRARTVGGSGGA